MPIIAKHLFTTLILALFLFGSQSVSASAVLSYTGNFEHESDVQFFDFSITPDSTSILIQTFSLNGGINNAGASILSGGFDPYLSLWDKSTGDFVYDTLFKFTGDEASISSAFYGTLLEGDYVLALTQSGNVAAGLNLSEGFTADLGLAEFGDTPFTANGGGGSNHWALDISSGDTNLGVSSIYARSAAVPTPETLSLLVMGLMVWGALARKKLQL